MIINIMRIMIRGTAGFGTGCAYDKDELESLTLKIKYHEIQ